MTFRLAVFRRLSPFFLLACAAAFTPNLLSQGGPPGDLYLTLKVRPHRFFSRKGNDLELDLPVTLAELVEGTSVDVPTAEGSVKMTIPPGSRSGARLRLRGKGVQRKGVQGGDLLVRLVLEMPQTEDPRLKEIAQELEGLYQGADLRKHLQDPG